MSETENIITWHSSLEDYLANLGEKAHCLSWCHHNAELVYSNRKTFIDLPVIILSAVTGFCSVGSSTMFEGQERLSSIVLGICSLLVSVLNTTGSYFGWAKRAEGHRFATLMYSKLYRKIVIELSLPREERTEPGGLLKQVREDYDRLQEVAPLLPILVIREFKSKFSGKDYNEVSKPEECNGLEHIIVYNKSSVYTNERGFIDSPIQEGFPHLPQRNSLVPQTSRVREGSPAGRRSEEGGQDGEHQVIRSVGDRYEEGHSDFEGVVIPRPAEGDAH
jgi:hypothetical protein